MKVIDTRNAGGQLVILGDALVPPTSNTTANASTSPLVAGSLRYNPTTDSLQFLQNSVSSWDSLLTPTQGNEIFLGNVIDTWQTDSAGTNRVYFANVAETRYESGNRSHRFDAKVYARDTASTSGFVGMEFSNSATLTGHVGFWTNAGTRAGYIGMANTTALALAAEGGRDLNIIANAALLNGEFLATHAYVNNAVNGLSVHPSVLAATTANITLSGTQTIDGVALIAGDRVLVKNQTSNVQNGIYVVAAGAWSRAVDMDQPAEVAGSSIWVDSGTTNGNTGWVGAWASGTTGTIGVDGVIFSQWGSWSLAGNASTISTGTLADARLSANVALKNDHIVPTSHNTLTLGSTSFYYANVYGANVTANAATIGNVAPLANAVSNIGTTATRYNVVHAVTFSGTATSAQYADLAERYHADDVYYPGTVLIIGGKNEVTISSQINDPRVAGIVSTAPAYRMNSDAGEDATHPYIALRGRVPCKVVGPIRKGDLLVTSSIPGHAMVASWDTAYSAVVGKALEDFSGDTGVIEVLV